MTKKRKKRVKKPTVVMLPSGYTITTSTNLQPGDIIWYPNAKKSFVQTTVDYLKRWFK